MRLLVLITEPPYPPTSATRSRNLHLWPAVARTGVDVKVLGTDPTGIAGALPDWGGLDSRFFRPVRDPLPARAFKGLTRSYHQFPRVDALAEAVDALAASWHPDVIHAEELRMAYYLPGLRGKEAGARALQTVTFHNVESDLYARIGAPAVPVGKGAVKALHLRSLRRFERDVLRTADVSFAYSATDRDRYAGLYPGLGRWSLTRNGTNALGTVPVEPPDTPTLLMVASWGYAPNRSGLLWFLDAVWPGLATEATLTVAGTGLDAGLTARLAGLGIRVVDTPLDLKPLYDAHALVVVPLFVGSGTRGKILEALAYGRMIVTTPKGPEGLDLRPGEGYVLAEDAGAMVARVRDALGSGAERSACARRGRAAVAARYDWSVVAAELGGVWRDRSASR